MLNKSMIYPLLPATLLSLFLIGCGDNKGFLDPEPEVSSLTAHPQVLTLKRGEISHVDLTKSVTAKNISRWQIKNLDDKTGLGIILNQQDTAFDYQATQVGVGTFNYTVVGDNLTATSQIVLAVNGGDTPNNNPPVANNVTLTTFNNVDAIVDLSNSVSDADGDTLRINKLVSASNRFSLDGFVVTFAPDGFVGIDQAVYSVDDGRGGYALAYIAVISKDANPSVPNTPPVAKDDNQSMDVADQSVLFINLSPLMSDADGDDLNVAKLYSTNDRAVLKEHSIVQYTPGNFRGVDQFTYLASDGNGGYDLGTITVTVTASNEIPPHPKSTLAAYQQAFVLDVGQQQTIDLTKSVTSQNLDTWSLISVQDKSNLGVVSGQTATTFNYLPQTPGVAQIDYSVQGGSLSAASTVTILINAPVTPDNNPPTASDVQLKTLNNTSKTIDLKNNINDIDGDTLTIRIHGSSRFTLNGTQVTFNPNGFIGLDQAVYSVDDGRGGYALANIVAISDDANPTIPNTPPTAKSQNYVIDVVTNPTLNIDLVAQNLIADADGDALTITQIFGVNNRATKQGDTSIIYTPGTFRGVDLFTYVITDGKGGYAMNAITVVVNDSTPANSIPTAGPVTAKMLHDSPAITISVSAAVNDADGDELNIVSISGVLGQASINPANLLEILYEPKGFVGTDRFVYVISDGNGGYAMGEVTVTVTDSNPTPPVANTVQQNTYLDTPINIDLSGYISDAETPTTNLVISKITSATSPATAMLNGQTVTYTPNGFTGNEILTYTVTDGRYSTDGVIVITVNDRSHTLTAADDAVVTNVGTPVSIDVTNNITSSDPSAAPFSVESAVGAVLGDVTFTGNVLTYTPKLGVYGKDTFVYTVKDSHTPAHYAQGVVSIAINSPPQPVITKVEASFLTNSFTTIQANVVCGTCDIMQYQYNWIVNGVTVGTGDKYTPTNADNGFNIRLSVSGKDAYGQIAPMQYVTLNRRAIAVMDGYYGGFWGIRSDGSMVVWGPRYKPEDKLNSGAKVVVASRAALASIKDNGTVETWGDPNNGGDSSSAAAQLASGVKTIYSTDTAFAAVKDDGSVVTWGDGRYGGDSSSVAAQLTSGVETIYSTYNSFAAVKDDGSVVTWGDPNNGGDSSSAAAQLTSGVKVIYSTSNSFAALKYNGSVVTWGESRFGGGDSSSVAAQLTSGVKVIYSSDSAFAALKDDGSVVTWGSIFGGGDSSSVAAQLTSGVKTVYSAMESFAALKDDGSVVTWGRNGGDSSMVAAQLTSGVKKIYSTNTAFAAVKDDGSVVTWGIGKYGGDSSSVAAQLTSGVETISSTAYSFAALKDDGLVVTWGAFGSNNEVTSRGKAIYASNDDFVVVKDDDSVVTLGAREDTTMLQPSLSTIDTSTP